ncbi:MAG: DUF6600 domain-containing protein [Verrucomicrobiota bacterium]
MKTNLLRSWRGILSVGGAVLLLGCLDQPGKSSAQSAVDDSPSNPTIAENAAEPEEVPPAKAVIAPANLSIGLPEIIQLAQSHVGDEVLLAYINKSGRSYNPTVDEIVYLKDLGLSEAVISALVRPRDGTAPSVPVEAAFLENKTPIAAPVANVNDSGPVPPPSGVTPSAPAYADAAPAPTQQVDYNYFESTLSPYGSWVDVPDYGRCWQPTVVVVNRDWRPYSDRGRWLYTSSGWYWQSDYSWGWAPFHYGRWHCDDRVGWVWSPDTTWGPAWVSWRYTDDYCGWAPLPPAARYDGFGFRYHGSHVGIGFDFGLRDDFYTFIPTGRFCDRTPYRYYASGSHSKTIYKNSVVVNNYIRGNNNTIINEGIGRDRVSRATRTPIHTVALRDLPATSNPAGRSERLEGNSLAVFRPNVAGTRSMTHSRSGSIDPATSVAARNQPSPVSPGTTPRVAPSSGRSETGRSEHREATLAATATPSPGLAPSAIPRTTSTSPAAIRHSNSSLDQRHLWTGRQSAAATTTPSAENPPARLAPASRQLPRVQYAPPTQRQTPSIVAENPRDREAALGSQQITRPQQTINSAPQPVRREYTDRQIQQNTPAPRVQRSLPSVRQPDAVVSDNGNRNGRMERSVPQVIQAAPRPAPQREQQQRQQIQQQPRPQVQQEQPPRSQPAPRQQIERSDRGNRDRNRN